MTAKEYLEQIRRLRVIVEQCKKEKAFLEHLQMMHLTNEQTKTHCQMLEKEVSAKIAELLPEIEMRAKQIEQLSNLKHFEILYQRYVMQKSMGHISPYTFLNYIIMTDINSYRHTINLHTQALEAFEAIYHNKRQESAEYGKI